MRCLHAESMEHEDYCLVHPRSQGMFEHARWLEFSNGDRNMFSLTPGHPCKIISEETLEWFAWAYFVAYHEPDQVIEKSDTLLQPSLMRILQSPNRICSHYARPLQRGQGFNHSPTMIVHGAALNTIATSLQQHP